MTDEPRTRVEKVVEIGAPVEAVWAALTTPEGLAGWYADRAEVTPGPGGSVKIMWDAAELPPSRIETWEPNRRLRLVHEHMVEEWLLEGRAGSTSVRFVASGFGEDIDWDEWYDQFESVGSVLLDLLSHWLEQHPGAAVTSLNIGATVPGDSSAEAWATLFGPHGLRASADPLAVEAGDDIQLHPPGGGPWDCSLRFVAPGDEGILEVGTLDRARLVWFVRPRRDGHTTVGLNLRLYGRPEAEIDAVRERLRLLGASLTALTQREEPGMPTEPRTERSYQAPDMPTLTPYICPRDAARAIDWYCDIFGATETGERFVGPDGRIGHADLLIGDSPLMLSDAHPEIGVDAPAADGGAVYSLYVYVPDVDATVSRAETEGAVVERPPADQFYGARSGVIRDPFGVRWMVTTHQRQPSKEEYQAAADAYRGG